MLRGSIAIHAADGPVACRTAFDTFAAAAAEYPPERVAAITGIDAAALQQAAAILAAAPSVAYYAWNGVGQSATATQTDRAISLLYSLTGSYGRKGGNVPGGAAAFADISGQDLLPPAQRSKALGLGERPLGPGLLGYVTARDVYRAALAGEPYPVRMLVSFGTNLIASQPDTDTARRALEALELHVHVDFFLNPTAQYADIVLPAATSWEREGLRTGFDGSLAGLSRVQLRPAVIAPLGQARSDTDIVLALAARLGLGDAMFGGSADRGHDAALAPSGLTVAALRQAPAGIELATSVQLEAHRQMLDGVPRGFPTPTRRIEVYSERLLAHGYAPVPTLPADDAAAVQSGYPLRLGSAKLVAFCHSQHRNIPALRRLAPDPAVEMAPEDAAARGIADGDWVRICTATGTAVARARLVPGLAPGTAFGQHGWWVEGPSGGPYDASRPLAASLNQLIDTAHADPVSGSVPMRASQCEIERLGEAVQTAKPASSPSRIS
jgi:anaerobic selenocysteine-containing dehydrogenase